MKKIYLILLITFLLLLIAGVLTMSHANEPRDTVEITSANGLQTYFTDPADKTAVLMNDITAPKGKAFVLPKGQNATLDLQGKTITGAKGIEVITIDGGNLTLKDTRKTGKITHNQNEGRGIFIVHDGSLTMTGGDITQNFAGIFTTGGDHGAGVYVKYGQFTMSGGSITQNSAKYGGGVCVSKDFNSGVDGQFTMMGGIITENAADEDGGGVCVIGHFTAIDGQICHNRAPKGGDVFARYVDQVEISGTASVGDFATAIGGAA